MNHIGCIQYELGDRDAAIRSFRAGATAAHQIGHYLVGAMSLGIVNKFLEPYAGAVLGKIFVLVVVILFIQKRPRGMFALKGRAVES